MNRMNDKLDNVLGEWAARHAPAPDRRRALEDRILHSRGEARTKAPLPYRGWQQVVVGFVVGMAEYLENRVRRPHG